MTINNMLKFSRFTYLDNNATTRVSDTVFDAMRDYLGIQLGNPSSNTSIGRRAKNAIEVARKQVANSIGATDKQIYFTSCGSESNSWAITSCIQSQLNSLKKTIITSPVEHDSVREHLNHLSTLGYNVHQLPVMKNGEVDFSDLQNIDVNDVLFASIMLVNNELGTINNLDCLKQFRDSVPAGTEKFPIHCDAIQALGKIKISVSDLDVDYLSISGHKIHAPKGVGALYAKSGQALTPMIWGHQENNLRGGTENVAFIVGFGQAVADAYGKGKDGSSFDDRIKAIQTMRDYIEKEISSSIDITVINGFSQNRVSNTTNLGFRGLDAIKLSLLLEQRGIFVSNGAACNIINPKQSHVLAAIQSETYNDGAIRISLSCRNTQLDCEYFVINLKNIISKIKGGN